MTQTESVVVCVTDQLSCERLIGKGAELAARYEVPLRVLSVMQPQTFDEHKATVLQALYDKAAVHGAQMTVYFNDTPVLIAAVHARQCYAVHLVLGTPGADSTRFTMALKQLLPDIPMTLLDPQGQEYTLPAMARTNRSS